MEKIGLSKQNTQCQEPTRNPEAENLISDQNLGQNCLKAIHIYKRGLRDLKDYTKMHHYFPCGLISCLKMISCNSLDPQVIKPTHCY